MIVYYNSGRIKACGHGAQVFSRLEGSIGGIRFKFASDTSSPVVRENTLVLPNPQDLPSYVIHILETGDILITEEHSMYLCRVVSGIVQVDQYGPVLPDQVRLSA